LKILTVILFALFIATEASADTGKIAIVTASELRCRQKPNIDSPIRQTFAFGMPIEIGAASPSVQTIEGRSSPWFSVDSLDCWVFGGFIIVTSAQPTDLELLVEDVIECGPRDGPSIPFEPLIIGDYYVAPTLAHLDPAVLGYPNTGALEIGKVTKASQELFFHGIMQGVYDLTGKWKRLDQLPKRSDNDVVGLKIVIDKQGPYYTSRNNSLDRLTVKRRCSKPSDIFYAGFYSPKTISSGAARISFPNMIGGAFWRRP
jgi:hypothetical protein